MSKSLLSKADREEEVRKMIERGLRQHEIAERLGVSLKTISNDARRIKGTRQMAEEKRLYAEDIQVIKDLPSVTIENVTKNNVEDAMLDVMKSILLEFKRRLPVISNEDVIKATMSFYKLDDRI